MYYVYVLFSQKDKSLYYGYTNDLKRRFNQHSKGLVNATMSRRSLVLIYYEAYLVKEDAINREKNIKKGSGRKRLKEKIAITLKNLNYGGVAYVPAEITGYRGD